ncbi:hypothetical protein [Streptomyces sp. RerS4]|uniref:hypothetical protein n=1 Tax=Streptomyces sp. RerS4 TaxID=2942449 RepID=UPI0024C0DC3E|nr:hypothetical protein [Streptomyces sp. RerS4]
MTMGRKSERDAETGESEGRALDLSATQIAGTSLATVAAALLASKLGVYGTILGAGVVSVVATAGGPVIQHVFRRTGDRLRESARPRGRQMPLPEAPAPSGEFGAATVHGTRVRGWKRTAVASAAAFAVAIGGLGTYEAVAGTSISSDGATLLSGGVRKAADHRPAPPREEPDGSGKGGREGGERESTPRAPQPGTSPSPSRSHDGGGGPAPDPSAPDPSASDPSAPDPGASDPGTPSPDPSPPKPPTKPTPKPDPDATPGPGGSAAP